MSDLSNPATKAHYGRYAVIAGVMATMLMVGNVLYEVRWFTILVNVVEPWLLTAAVLCWLSDRLLPYVARIPKLVATLDASRRANESVAAALAVEPEEESATVPMLKLVPSVVSELDARTWRAPPANSRTS